MERWKPGQVGLDGQENAASDRETLEIKERIVSNSGAFLILKKMRLVAHWVFLRIARYITGSSAKPPRKG
jgi:hypothetical protein